MPELKTPGGKPVELDEAAVNAAFDQAMNDDGPDTAAPPKRAPKTPADDEPKPRRTRTPKAEKARTTKAAAKPQDDGTRREGVKGLAQIGAGIALMLGKATRNEAFTADAVIIASQADALADACVETARADARFAAALDRVTAVGPYGALITVAVGIGSQIARNHGMAVPGTMDPADLISAQAEAEALAA